MGIVYLLCVSLSKLAICYTLYICDAIINYIKIVNFESLHDKHYLKNFVYLLIICTRVLILIDKHCCSIFSDDETNILFLSYKFKILKKSYINW